MGPYGGENFKMLLLLQIAAKYIETCPKFSSQWSSQNDVGDFWNLIFWFLTIFVFENSNFTIVAYGEMKNLNYLEKERS